MSTQSLPVRKVPVRTDHETPDLDALASREWLVCNGLGGYASGTLAGLCTRRYHGLLVAALPPPFGRTMMFNHLSELVRLPDGTRSLIGGWGREAAAQGAALLEDFRLEHGLPVWRYHVGGVLLERRVVLVHQQNTVHVSYRLLSGAGPVRLKLRPSVHFRPHDDPVDLPVTPDYSLTVRNHRYEVKNGTALPPLRLFLSAQESAFTVESQFLPELIYWVEESRGYGSRGGLWTPGYFRSTLYPGHTATLMASTETWDDLEALTPEVVWEAEEHRRAQLLMTAVPAAREGVAAELVLAADAFLVAPTARRAETIMAQAEGQEPRTVIAGYHWFTDWGRDTMISLEGLTLMTGRPEDARRILLTFARHVKDGLIPNFFSEHEGKAVYHTADASLWFFHAIERYLAATDDWTTLELLFPKLEDVIAAHRRGTQFGIGVDEDGLLRQGAEGYQLTWMDAKVGDWVVTPRRGKAVEINGLWHNALCLQASWRERLGQGDPRELFEEAERHRRAFNERFWYEEGGYLYDVVDGEQGDDASLRPNQLLAFSLRYPVLMKEFWEPVLNVTTRELLTPVGLRSLARGHRDYRSEYFGDLRARDAAYHQGTVWSWLIGPFVDAWRKLHPEDDVRRFLHGLIEHLGEAGIGSVSEIFDAEPPHTPRGCIAQAWGVAELLRTWVSATRTA